MYVVVTDMKRPFLLGVAPVKTGRRHGFVADAGWAHVVGVARRRAAIALALAAAAPRLREDDAG
jgi:hypothetical protein